MKQKEGIIPAERIHQSILLIRGQKVMVDSDLADLYGIKTKILNQTVKRNTDRFPEDFMFQLTAEEKQEVVTNCDHLRNLKYSPYLPYVFTEHGTIMLAGIINSSIAINASILVVRAFVQVREILLTNKELAHKLEDLEQKYDEQFRVVFTVIRQLMEPPENNKREPLGYQYKNKK